MAMRSKLSRLFVVEQQTVPGRHWTIYWSSEQDPKPIVGFSLPRIQMTVDEMNLRKNDPPQRRFRVAVYEKIKLPDLSLLNPRKT